MPGKLLSITVAKTMVADCQAMPKITFVTKLARYSSSTRKLSPAILSASFQAAANARHFALIGSPALRGEQLDCLVPQDTGKNGQCRHPPGRGRELRRKVSH